MEQRGVSGGGWRVGDIRWRGVGLGYLVGVVVTLAAGLPLFLIRESSWLFALAGLGGLLLGGFIVGRRVGPQLAPVNGALLGVLYYFTVALAFLAGSFLQVLPEPLPGLPQGDSTFFFAWPLSQFVVSILGAVLGSRTARGVRKVT